MKRLLLLCGIIACWTSVSLQGQGYIQVTPNNCVSTGVDTLSYSMTMVPPPSSNATITYYYQGDLDGGVGGNEYFDLFDENGNLLQTSNCTGGCSVATGQCLSTQDSIVFTVPQATVAQWATDGQIDFKAFRGSGVSQTLCTTPGSCVQIKIEYTSTSGNCATQFTNFLVDSISGTAAKIDWVPGTGNSSFYMEYGPAGFTPGSGTSITGTYPGTQPPVILTGLSAQTTYDVYFGEICNSGADSVYFPAPVQFNTTKLCAPPNTLTASNVLSSTVDLSWNYAGTAQSFDVIYGPTGFNPATGGSSVTTSSGSPYTLSGLNPATFYDAYLVAYCGPSDGYSDTIGPVNFLTLCVLKTLPYIEDFSGGVFPPCWSRSSTTDVQYLASCSSRNDVIEILQQEDATTADIDVSGVLNQNLEVSYYIGAGACNNNPEDEDFIVEYWDGSQWVEAIRYNGNQMPNAFVRGSFFVLAGQFGHPFKVRFNMLEGTTDTWQVDSVVVEQGPACLNPTAQQISFSSIDSNQATVFIGDSISDVDYEWGPCGFTQGTGTFGTDSLGTANLTGLSPNTCYDVFLRRDCDTSGISPWAGPFSFTTTCSFFGAPYSQNFDGTTEPEIDNCWTAIGHGQSGAEVQTEDLHSNSAPNGLEIHNSSNTTGFVGIATPAFFDLDNTKRIKFWTYDEDGAFDGSDLIIGTMSNPLDPSTFAPYDTITEGDMDDDAWEFFIVEFDNYTGTDKHIVFRHGMNTTFDNIHIDDFTYEDIPLCNPPLITTLGVSGVGITTATATWGSGSAGNETHIEWGTPGFTPGNNAFTGTDSVAGSVDMYTMTGLTAQTNYEYYIRDSCVTNGFSPWIGPISFTTACNVQTAPFLENFDGPSWVASGSTTGNQIDVCWSSDVSPGGESFNWIPRSTGPTSGNGPLQDLTGNNFMYCEASSPAAAGDTAYLTTPPIDVSTLTAPALYFWQHRFNTPADMNVEVSNDFGATWTNVYNITGNLQSSSSAPWEDEFVNLPQYVGDTIIVRFVQISVGCCDDAAIDSVAIDEAPTCPDPGNLNVSSLLAGSATLNWIGSLSATDYQVWYGPQGFFQGTQATGGTQAFVGGTSTSYGISGLTANSCYEFLVRGVCGPGDTTSWIGPFAFCTPCAAIPAPYAEDFDNLTTGLAGDFGNCWLGLPDNTSSYSWRSNNGTTGSASTGPNGDATTGSGIYLYTEASSGTSGDVAELYSPFVDLTGQSNPRLKFSYHMFGANIDTLFVDIHDGVQWNTAALQLNEQQQSASSDPWLDTTLSLAPYSANNLVQVRFRLRSRGCCPGDAAIDDVEIGDAITDDAGIDAILLPEGCGDSSTTVEVAFTNYGVNPITSMPVTVNITGSISNTLNATYNGNLAFGASDTVTMGIINTYAGAAISLDASLNLAADQVGLNDTMSMGPTAFIPYEPQVYPGDTVCVTQDSVDIAALTIPGVNYSWYLNPTDTIPVATGDSARVALGGSTAFYAEYQSNSDSLGTPFAGGNGQAGNAFDILPANTISITGLSVNIDNSASHSLDVYFKTGTYVGNETSLANWTLHETVSITGQGAGNKTPAPFSNSFVAQAGQTYGVMVVLTTGTNMDYTNGGSVGSVLAQNSDLTIYEGAGISWPLASNFTTRNWNGVIHYGFQGCSQIRTPVNFTLTSDTATASFSTTATGGNSFTFDASASVNANAYDWDFGDGNTGTGVNPSHTYSTGGNYTVVLTVIDTTGCESTDTAMSQVNFDLEENPLAQSLDVFPNPTDGKVVISFEPQGTAYASIRLTDLRGREILNIKHDDLNGRFSRELSLEGLSKGIYLIEVHSGDLRAYRRVTLH